MAATTTAMHCCPNRKKVYLSVLLVQQKCGVKLRLVVKNVA